MNINSNVYAEVNAVLESMAEEYTNKIPVKLKKLISNYRNKSYSVKYDFNKPLHEQNISKEALSIIALIHLNYWCKDENEKKELYKIFQDNEIKNENEKRLKYSPNNIFKNKYKDIEKDIKVEENDDQEINQNVQMTVYKENILQKCINFIKRIFNKLH